MLGFEAVQAEVGYQHISHKCSAQHGVPRGRTADVPNVGTQTLPALPQTQARGVFLQ